jgi:hypothetical protein
MPQENDVKLIAWTSLLLMAGGVVGALAWIGGHWNELNRWLDRPIELL